MFKSLWVTVALCLLLAAPAVAVTSNYSLVVNGTQVYTDVSPVVEGSKVLVPLRAVAEATGASVQYVDSERELIISKPGLEVKLWVDNYSGFKNGTPIVLTSPPKIVNDRTLVTRELLTQIMDVKAHLNVKANSIEVR
ncbi:hypothetical protein Psch_00172 [Pelotomaculum schinkii]|uniref:Copper amine oxidase-like N-terminal domain-containing protein n=1 Tax=Pelotomaculum schinkii TaxID=78350 RepID=A0A4Y7RD41_9FIRM|nr:MULTISPECIES: copper amine oxidase N-terminal domain-containing protein [Pelotomaculum]TEB06640.1 hypothetical protein Psch_00172 [Pelotomaculum schinkii]TEB17565.1 hypothetical protein Psfp_00437 [Pelotomaculum sp. FP]